MDNSELPKGQYRRNTRSHRMRDKSKSNGREKSKSNGRGKGKSKGRGKSKSKRNPSRQRRKIAKIKSSKRKKKRTKKRTMRGGAEAAADADRCANIMTTTEWMSRKMCVEEACFLTQEMNCIPQRKLPNLYNVDDIAEWGGLSGMFGNVRKGNSQTNDYQENTTQTSGFNVSGFSDVSAKHFNGSYVYMGEHYDRFDEMLHDSTETKTEPFLYYTPIFYKRSGNDHTAGIYIHKKAIRPHGEKIQLVWHVSESVLSNPVRRGFDIDIGTGNYKDMKGMKGMKLLEVDPWLVDYRNVAFWETRYIAYTGLKSGEGNVLTKHTNEDIIAKRKLIEGTSSGSTTRPGPDDWGRSPPPLQPVPATTESTTSRAKTDSPPISPVSLPAELPPRPPPRKISKEQTPLNVYYLPTPEDLDARKGEETITITLLLIQ